MLYFFPVLQDCEKNNQRLESHMKDLDEKC